jgi:hypothetical protein
LTDKAFGAFRVFIALRTTELSLTSIGHTCVDGIGGSAISMRVAGKAKVGEIGDAYERDITAALVQCFTAPALRTGVYTELRAYGFTHMEGTYPRITIFVAVA